jgi:hypothetical protein
MQVQQALRPLMSNLKEYQTIRAEALGAKDTVSADFAERMKDRAEQVRSLKVQANELSITTGDQLLPTIDSASDRFSKWGERITDFSNRHPQLTRGLTLGAAAFAALFIIIGGAAFVLAGLVAPFAILSAAATALGIGLLPLIGIAAAIVAGIVALGAITYWLYENWGNWPKMLDGIFNALKFIITNFKPLGILAPAFGAVLDYLRSLNFAEVGRNLIQGLINGLTAKVAHLKATVKGIADSTASWFRSALGIHSPSRVFASLGGFVMAGLDQGLAANTSGPLSRITDLSGQMTRALAVGASAGTIAAAGIAPAAAQAPASSAATSGAAGNTYHIKIEVSGGAGATDIADEVRKAIEAIERERKGRGFSDT